MYIHTYVHKLYSFLSIESIYLKFSWMAIFKVGMMFSNSKYPHLLCQPFPLRKIMITDKIKHPRCA